MTTPVLTSREVAKLLGCNPSTVYHAAASGGMRFGDELLRPITIGRRVVWPAKPLYDALNLPVPDDAAGAAA